MAQAQHPSGTPHECRLDVKEADTEPPADAGGAGNGIQLTQEGNSQYRAQDRAGSGIDGSSSQSTNTNCAQVANAANGVRVQMTDAERQIRPLLALRGLERTHFNMCKVALEEWQTTADLFGKRVDKRNEEVRSIRNEIYQLVGFFSAFQGLLITAVAQSSLLKCQNVGFPLALSAIATVAAVIGMGQKNALIRQLKRTNLEETPTRKALVGRVQKLKQEGTDFNFGNIDGDKSKLKKKKYYTIWSLLFSYETGIVITLIAFGGLCMAAMRQILCSSG